jgi:hypothetical protein
VLGSYQAKHYSKVSTAECSFKASMQSMSYSTGAVEHHDQVMWFQQGPASTYGCFDTCCYCTACARCAPAHGCSCVFQAVWIPSLQWTHVWIAVLPNTYCPVADGVMCVSRTHLQANCIPHIADMCLPYSPSLLC